MKINSKLLTKIKYKANNAGAISIGFIGIEWGTVTIAPSSGSSPDYYGSAQVTFKNTYTHNPCMIANAGAGYQSIKNVSTLNVTTTSGTVWAVASATTSRIYKYFVIGFVNN
ncbi:MAG: hypothetical protein IJL74_02775 [Bacilli bacterium]|nr:hypothetical protein [Bacilli bacterium]